MLREAKAENLYLITGYGALFWVSVYTKKVDTCVNFFVYSILKNIV